MSGYLLCSSPLAKNPYPLRETGLLAYSAEELCYYIYNNFYLIDEDFFCEELYAFMEVELGLTKEAARLRELKEDNQGIVPLLVSFLHQFRYYTETEIKEFQLKYEEFQHYPLAKRRSMKADFLLKQGHCLSAIQMYHQLGEGKKDPSLTPDFMMKNYQHMAVGYIRLGLFAEALQAYLKAYEALKNEELLRQIYQFSLFSSQTLPGKIYQDIKPEWEVSWREEYEDVKAQGGLLASTGPAAGLFTKDSIRRKEAVGKYIEGIKKNYRTAIS